MIVVGVLIFTGARSWLLWPGYIAQLFIFGPRRFSQVWWEAKGVVIKRGIWRDRQGSTDSLVITTSASPFVIGEAHNWPDGSSTLTNSGYGSLSRAGSKVPTAPHRLLPLDAGRERGLVNEAILELGDVFATELRLPISYETEQLKDRPDDMSE